MTKNPLTLICDGKAALDYSPGSNEPGPNGLPLIWLCRPNGERLELIRGLQEAHDRAAALIEKGAL